MLSMVCFSRPFLFLFIFFFPHLLCVLGAVPCLRRASSIAEEYEAAGGEILLDDEDGDGWLATHGKPKGMFSNWTPE